MATSYNDCLSCSRRIRPSGIWPKRRGRCPSSGICLRANRPAHRLRSQCAVRSDIKRADDARSRRLGIQLSSVRSNTHRGRKRSPSEHSPDFTKHGNSFPLLVLYQC